MNRIIRDNFLYIVTEDNQVLKERRMIFKASLIQ